MSPRLRPSNRMSPRPAVRTILVAGTASCILLGIIGSVIWQSFRKEEVSAGLPRIISAVQTSVPLTVAFKGTFRQPLLRLSIETSGEGKSPELQQIELSLAGTSTEILSILEPSGIFATASPQFSDDQQIKLTDLTIDDKTLRAEMSQALQQGTNYIWITFNIKGENTPVSGDIKASCSQVSIGNLFYEPTHNSLLKGTRILPHKVWYSSSSGDISNLSTWNSKRDGSGTAATSFSEDTQVFFIQSGSVLSNRVNACISNLVIERGGTLQSSTELKADSAIIESRGIWNQITPFKDKNSIKNFIVRGGGNYLHNNSGPLPGRNRSLENGSLVLLRDVSGLDSSTSGWGNVIIDLGEKQQAIPVNFLQEIKGTLECKSGIIRLQGTGMINISTDLVFTGGTMLVGNPGDSVTCNTVRNLKVTSGGISAGKNTALVISVGNSLTIQDGFVELNRRSWIFPSGTITRPFKWKQTGGVVTLGQVVLEPGTVLVAEGNTIGPVTSGAEFTVKHHARIDLGNAVITGHGTYLLNKEAIMATSHEQGIWSKGSMGCIQTSGRIFSSEAGYIYSSAQPIQRTGVFTTVPDREKVGILRFFKHDPSQKIILERNFVVSDNYSLIRGTLEPNGFKVHPQYEDAGAGISSR